MTNIPDLSQVVIQEDPTRKTYDNTIDSRTIAKCMSYAHCHLLEKIRVVESRYEDTSQLFSESTYLNKSHKVCRRYDITKEGCQLLSRTLKPDTREYFNLACKALFNTDSRLGAYLRMNDRERTKAYERLIKENDELKKETR